jgi:outer membrane protein OmpA-like peptidoglycan-associated protein
MILKTKILIVLAYLLFHSCGFESPSNNNADFIEIKTEQSSIKNDSLKTNSAIRQELEKPSNLISSAEWANPVMNIYGANLGEYIKALFITYQFDEILNFIQYPSCYDKESIKHYLLNSDFGYDISLTNLKWQNDSLFQLSYKALKNNTNSLDIFHGIVINDTAKLFFYPNNENPFKSNGINEFNELCNLKASLENINFDFNSAKIQSNSISSLKEILNYIRQNNMNQILITGHTSSEGSKSFNLELSRLRAKSVYVYLITNGISKNKLKYEGRGDLEPIYLNDSEINRERNRRVEIEFSL